MCENSLFTGGPGECPSCGNVFWKYGSVDLENCFICGICGHTIWSKKFEPESIEQPKHYTQGDVECIDAIKSALGDDGFIDFLRGQVMKYIWRCRDKGETEGDVAKAIRYAEWLLDMVQGQWKTPGKEDANAQADT